MRYRLLLTAACLVGLAHPAGAADSGQAPVAALDHVAINAADQQKSIDFYAGMFGLKEIPAPFPPGGPRWMALADGVALHIQHLPEKPAPPSRASHFAIAVADLDAVVAYLRAHNLQWFNYAGEAGKIQDARTDHVRQLFVQDPDGYWIEVNDKLKPGR